MQASALIKYGAYSRTGHNHDWNLTNPSPKYVYKSRKLVTKVPRLSVSCSVITTLKLLDEPKKRNPLFCLSVKPGISGKVPHKRCLKIIQSFEKGTLIEAICFLHRVGKTNFLNQFDLFESSTEIVFGRDPDANLESPYSVVIHTFQFNSPEDHKFESATETISLQQPAHTITKEIPEKYLYCSSASNSSQSRASSSKEVSPEVPVNNDSEQAETSLESDSFPPFAQSSENCDNDTWQPIMNLSIQELKNALCPANFNPVQTTSVFGNHGASIGISTNAQLPSNGYNYHENDLENSPTSATEFFQEGYLPIPPDYVPEVLPGQDQSAMVVSTPNSQCDDDMLVADFDSTLERSEQWNLFLADMQTRDFSIERCSWPEFD